MGETSIQWTSGPNGEPGYTFNGWIGCTMATYTDAAGKRHVHDSCHHCYAKDLAHRYGWAKWGAGEPRRVKAESGWKEPLKWAREAAKAGQRRKVFAFSLGDVLDEEMDKQPEMRVAFDRLMDLIRYTSHRCWVHGPSCPAHLLPGECVSPRGGLDWLLLTKRPERWRLIPEDVRPLVWLGTSIADQATWDEWTPRLARANNFARRFVSVEPQIGPIRDTTDALGWLDWVICGGESGHKARPLNLTWARSLRGQCREAGVPFFMKQYGAHPFLPDDDGHWARHVLDSHGGDPTEWAEEDRVRQWPS